MTAKTEKAPIWVRHLALAKIQLRAVSDKEDPKEDKNEPGESCTVVGHAAVFNSLSQDLGGFREILSPGCFARALEKIKSDPEAECYSLFNHNADRVLGSTNDGTLRVSEDKMGLYQETDLDEEDSDGQRALLRIRSGKIKRMSFAFLTAPGGADWDYKDGALLRTVNDVSILADVSPVTYAAYPAASIGARGAGILSVRSPELSSILIRSQNELPVSRTELETLKEYREMLDSILKRDTPAEEPQPVDADEYRSLMKSFGRSAK